MLIQVDCNFYFLNYLQAKDNWIKIQTLNLNSETDKSLAGSVFLKRYVEAFKRSRELKISCLSIQHEPDLIPQDEVTHTPCTSTPSTLQSMKSSSASPILHIDSGICSTPKPVLSSLSSSSKRSQTIYESPTEHNPSKRKRELENADNGQNDCDVHNKNLEKKKKNLAKIRAIRKAAITTTARKKNVCSDCRTKQVKFIYSCGHMFCALCIDNAKNVLITELKHRTRNKNVLKRKVDALQGNHIQCYLTGCQGIVSTVI